MRLVLLFLASATSLAAQQPPDRVDMTISAATRDTVITGILNQLDRAYVFPEKAKAMREAISARKSGGEYEKMTSAIAFADSLTSHLQAVSRDKHLRVRYDANPGVAGPRGPSPADRERAQVENYGVSARMLEGNVGYVELRTFGFPPNLMEKAVADAMTTVAGADALIIDVRRNGGGSPGSVRLVSSYLFGTDSVHLNSLYFRPANTTDHFWTSPTVAGTRYGATKPVYVLTSKRTFSAAEEFTYNLQSRKRATIVGETTGGGAHPGGLQRINAHFGVFVPSGRAINPITGTNWEGTGVVPEIKVPADSALDAALRETRRKTASE